MSLGQLTLTHRIIDGQHVFTSDELPELWVAHEDERVASADVLNVIDRIMAIKGRAVRSRVRTINLETT